MAIETDILYDEVNHMFYGTPAFLAGNVFYDWSEMYLHAINVEDNPENGDAEEFFTLDANQLTYKTNKDLYFQQSLMTRLKGASLETTGYTGSIRLVEMDAAGYVGPITTDRGALVTGATSGDTGYLLDWDNTSRKWWIRVVDAQAGGDEFDVAEAFSLTGGTGAGTSLAASQTGEELFGNINSIGTVANGFAYIYRGVPGAVTTKIASFWGEGNYDGNGAVASDLHIDVLIKVKEAGQLIDGGNVIVFNRNWGDTFDHATANLSGGGRTTVSLATSSDGAINITEVEAENYFNATNASVSTTFGSFVADVNDDSVNENYDVQINADGTSESIYYQVAQWLTYKDSTQVLNGEDGEAYIFANNSYTPNKKAPLGSFSAGSFIGAQGVYVINSGGGSYVLTDSSGADNIEPPESFPFGYGSGLVPGDQLGVYPKDAITGKTKKDFFTFVAAGAGVTALDVVGPIPKYLPQSFHLVVVYADRSEQIIEVTSFSGSTMQLAEATTGAVLGTDTGYYIILFKVATQPSETVPLRYTEDVEHIYRVRNSSPASPNKIKRVRVDSVFSAGGNGGVVPASRSPETLVA